MESVELECVELECVELSLFPAYRLVPDVMVTGPIRPESASVGVLPNPPVTPDEEANTFFPESTDRSPIWRLVH